MNDDLASIALCDPLDSEQEEGEKKSKEESDDKIQFMADRLEYLVSLEKWKIFLTADYPSLYHPEIHTPPPERFVFPA